jgi:hypothetical protein
VELYLCFLYTCSWRRLRHPYLYRCYCQNWYFTVFMTARPNARATFEFLMECRMLDMYLTQRRLLISWCWCLYKRYINSYRRTYLIFLQNSELSTSFSPNMLVQWNTVELHSRGAWFQPLLEHRLYRPQFLQAIAGVVRR